MEARACSLFAPSSAWPQMIVETDSPFLYHAVSAVAHVAGGSRVWPGWRQLAALKSLRRGVSGEVLASSEYHLGSVYGRALSVRLPSVYEGTGDWSIDPTHPHKSQDHELRQDVAIRRRPKLLDRPA